MFHNIWRKWLHSAASSISGRQERKPHRRPCYQPRIELLEDRLAPALFTVTTNADSGVGSLRAAITAANANAEDDTITFTAALTNQTITLGGTALPIISKPLAIVGLGLDKLTIDANNASKIFEINDGAAGQFSVSISGLKLTRGGNTGNGGAIYNNENLTLTNSILSGNHANINGGGIYNVGTMTVTNSTLSGNFLSNGDGGAIYNVGAMTVINSTLSLNSASNGGAIENVGTLTVTGSTLSSNFAASFGGGIVNYSGTLTLTNATLSGNSAHNGGGIYSTGFVALTNSTLSGNFATFTDQSAGFGAAIYIIDYNQGGTLILTNSTLSANFASASGGAIYTNNCSVTLANSTLSNNSASGDGGGVYDTDGPLTVTNSVLSRNSASNTGGGICITNNATLTLTGSTLASNSASNGGGGIYIDPNCSAAVTNSTISGNSASNSAGAGVQNRGALNLTNSTVSGNFAGGNGGGLFNLSDATLVAFNCTIVSNSTSLSGGGISTVLGSTTLINTIVGGNFATTSDKDISGNLDASSDHNLISDVNSAGGLSNGINGNIVGQSLFSVLNTTLRNNGGSTLTAALLPGSVAIDAGNPAVLTAASEQQTVTLSGTLSGSFTLTFTGPDSTSQIASATTGSLTGNSPTLAADAQVALNSLSTIGGVGGSVNVSKTGNVLNVTFSGTLANTDVAQLTSTASGGLTAAVVTTRLVHGALTTDQRGAGFPRRVDAQVDIGAFEMPRPLFSDDFNRTSYTALGAPWVNQAGGVGINGNLAQGTSLNANVATLAGLVAADVDLYADVNLQAGAQSGLIARFVDVNNYYAATLTRESTGLVTARLVKFVGGVYTELAVYERLATSGKLRLRVVGNTLQMFTQGNAFPLASAIDFSLSAGSVGVRTFGSLSTLDNFQAWPISTGIDRFDPFSLSDNTTLADPWVQSEGYFRITNSRIQGGQAVNRAVLQAASANDVDVRANIGITGNGHFASLLARYNGAADSWYQGTLVRDTSGTLQAYLFKRIAGAFTQIGAAATIPSVSGNGNARLLITGTNLKLFINDVLVLEGSDASLAAGTAGIRSDNYAFFDDFSVRALRTDLPFAENFNGSTLDLPWASQGAPFTLTGGTAVPSTNTVSLATLAGVNAANAEVQAEVAITNTGGVASLVLGYNGPGNTNYYTALAYRQPGNSAATPYSLYLFRNDAGNYVQLGPEVKVAALGTLKFRMLGSQLTLLLNNVTQITATDATYGRGSVGIRGFINGANPGTVTIDNFSASDFGFVPFSDGFTPATLDPNWQVRAGGYTTTATAGKAKGTTGANLMTLGRLDVADVDVQAAINIPNLTAGHFAAIAARVSTAADPDFYQAVIYSTGTQFNADIYKRVGGVFTQLGTTSLGASPSGGIGVLRFTVVGSQLKLFKDGVEKLSVYDFSLKSGSVGLRSSLDPTFDDFSVTQAT